MTVAAARTYSCQAELDARTLAVLVPRATLAAALAPNGLQLPPQDPRTPGQHPVCVEIWRVIGGRAHIGPYDQHDWFDELGRRWGLALGGPAAVRTAGAIGRRWSRALAATLGSYNEMVVGVPDVCPLGDPMGQRFLFVLGMWNDHPPSRWGEWALGFGYGKRPAVFTWRAPGDVDIQPAGATAGGPVRLQSATGGGGGSAQLSMEHREHWEHWARWFSQPLLGRVNERLFAVSFLERSLGDRRTTLAPMGGRLIVPESFISGLPAGDYSAPALSVRAPWGGLHATALPVRLTNPLHVFGVPSSRGLTYHPAHLSPP
jgi:hypothetical protein